MQNSIAQTSFDFDSLIDVPVDPPRLHLVEAQPQKRCTKCKKMKDLSRFSRKKSRHRSWCKDCHNAYVRERRAQAADTREPQPQITEQLCEKCQQVKGIEHFARKRGKSGKYHSWCKQCMNDRKNEAYDNTKSANLAEHLGSFPDAEIDPNTQYKQCTKCYSWLPYDRFTVNREVRDGRASWCKDCCNERSRKTSTPVRRRKYMLQHDYGITLEEYNQMLEAQGGVCACCGNFETHRNSRGEIAPLSVDHCHRTGNVRALLCCDCNVAYGHLKEDESRILALLSYHKKINPES